MKHISVAIYKKRLYFKTPFKIAYEEVVFADIIIVRLSDDNGLIGLGSASPDAEVTGETVQKVHEILNKKLIPEFFSLPLHHIYRYHDKIGRIFSDYPSAQMAVEEAILNLLSQQTTISLPHLFGGYRDSCEIMITIGIKDIEATLSEITQRLKEGFTIIKLKCGLDVKSDLDKIKKILSLLPKQIEFILDANQGYSFVDAAYLLQHINQMPISFLEQPIDATDKEGLKKLHQTYNTPIFADESVVSLDDAIHLLTNDYVDGVNIKLMKCGGPINFLKIFHLTKSFHKKIVLGCMYESNISITTGAALALALPIDYVDLDSGPLDFIDDPAKGGSIVQRGKIYLDSPLSFQL